MANIEDFDQGARILQQVDVSEIFTSLALGIAEAQKNLDDNSINQLIKLSEQEINGKSLLELGFVPAFYSFTYADISASIHLKMAQKSSFDFGFEFSIDVAKNKDYTEDDFEFFSKNSFQKKSKKYKSSNELHLKASEKNHFVLDDKSYALNHSEGSVKMISDLKEELYGNQEINEVQHEVKSLEIEDNISEGYSVFTENGYVVVKENLDYKLAANTYFGLFRITEFPSPTSYGINASDTFGPFSDFSEALSKAKTANSVSTQDFIFGLGKDGMFFNNGTPPVDATIYFYHDNMLDASKRRRGAEIVYDESSADIKINNSAEHKLIHQNLLFLYKHFPEVKITITGYTDTSGSDEYNESLGMRRAQALKNHIFGDAAEGIELVSKGEGDSGPDNTVDKEKRKATITLDADYIIFKGGKLGVGAALLGQNTNGFVYVEEHLTDLKTLSFDYSQINYNKVDEFAAIKSYLKSKTGAFYAQETSDRIYLLHHEAIIKFYLFSEDKSEINIEYDKSDSKDKSKSKDSYIDKQSSKAKEKLKQTNTETKGNKSVALSGSIDLRMSKQFEMSVEGNSSMSARMVAAPPPTAFLEHINNTLNED